MIGFQILGGLFDLDSKINRKEEIEKLMLDSSFWDDSDRANELTSELKGIKSVICNINNLDDHISSNIDLLNVVSEDEDELSLLIFDEYKELETEFMQYATEKGMVGIKGHRSVGGFRASCYNAMSVEGVKALVDCMKEFELKH